MDCRLTDPIDPTADTTELVEHMELWTQAHCEYINQAQISKARKDHHNTATDSDFLLSSGLEKVYDQLRWEPLNIVALQALKFLPVRWGRWHFPIFATVIELTLDYSFSVEASM